MLRYPNHYNTLLGLRLLTQGALYLSQNSVLGELKAQADEQTYGLGINKHAIDKHE